MKTPKINKSGSLSILAVLILVALLSYGIVKYQQNRVKTEAANAQAAQARQAVVTNLKMQNTSLQAQVTSEKTKRQAVCSYVQTLATGKLTKTLVTVPAISCTP